MARQYLVLVLFLLVSVPITAEDGGSVIELIEGRLLLMKSIAAHKWRNDLPIEDPGREAEVLDSSVRGGLTHGLTRPSATDFFQAQINAAREVQQYWFDRWRQGAEVPDDVPDLESELRPRLNALGELILAAASRALASGTFGEPAVLNVEGLPEAESRAIIHALKNLARYPDRLTQILDSGTLRIGTTGDYAPFSIREDGEGEFQGIDVDLGRDLAVALGVQPVFIATSWPTLMADLRQGKFDIAMSGVSRTLERQRHGFFSRPYHLGGKTAVTRCSDGARFRSLDDIDREGVRVVVNPGGTNERFVDSRIRAARKVLHADNRTIFSRIVNGDADVMITDRIEADWQAARNPELCAPVAGNFTYQEKAYLMPRDIALKEFVDTWLSLRIAEGKINQLLVSPD